MFYSKWNNKGLGLALPLAHTNVPHEAEIDNGSGVPEEASITATSIAFSGPAMTEKLPLVQRDASTSRGLSYPVPSYKSLALGISVSCAALIWVLAGPVPAIDRQLDVAPTPASTVQVTDNVAPEVAKRALLGASPSPTPGVVDTFQVYQPVLPEKSTEHSDKCETLLMDHSFGSSYGSPFVGQYTPPTCDFNHVTINFTVTSRGRQFDRIALMYFNDTEVWRTSTSEPRPSGIRWEYLKDMSEYYHLWKSPQTIIFDLGNIVNQQYDGAFNTTLTASFSTVKAPELDPAPLIIPISAGRGDESAASVFVLPDDTANSTVKFPRNANRAVFSVSATGQRDEEFWWSNSLQSDVETFAATSGATNGYSPFREVQVLIDGQLAGVHWPFPVIFTGGVLPSFWRPIAGIDAYDLREHEINISPWLPLLSDGKDHTFEIRVVGIIDDGKQSGSLSKTVGSNWLVTGKIFVWLDDNSTSITTGKAPTIDVAAPTITLSQTVGQNSTGANDTLDYTANVRRSISITNEITTANSTFKTGWTQTLEVTSFGKFTKFGTTLHSGHTTTGKDVTTGPVAYETSYHYPLKCVNNYTALAGGNYTINAEIERGLELSYSGHPVFPTGLETFTQSSSTADRFKGLSRSSLNTTQSGVASYFAAPSHNVSHGIGRTNQEFTFKGFGSAADAPAQELYFRNVSAYNNSVTHDLERLLGAEQKNVKGAVEDEGETLFVVGEVHHKRGLGPLRSSF